jgi:hypothetical protein
MPWIKFVKDFRWDPPERNGRVTVSFKAGAKVLVRRKCADDAIASGAAKPERKE